MRPLSTLSLKYVICLDYNYGWIKITEILTHPKYSTIYQHNPEEEEWEFLYDVALLKLEDSIDRHEFTSLPLPDTLRPVCLLPDYHQNQLENILRSYDHVLTARFLETQETKIISRDDCINHRSNALFNEYHMSLKKYVLYHLNLSLKSQSIQRPVMYPR